MRVIPVCGYACHLNRELARRYRQSVDIDRARGVQYVRVVIAPTSTVAL